MASQLPPPRLVITTHTPEGTSIIARDETTTPYHPFGPQNSSFAIFHMARNVPVSNFAPLAPTTTSIIPRPLPTGTFFGTTDIPVGAKVPMHRTISMDYGVVLEGSIWLILDGGEETEIKRGEFVLQRGTNHSWQNRGEGPCRILFVMVGAEMIKLNDGTELEETKLGKPPGAAAAE